MIPILYGRNERSFSSNGLGRLSDIISCLVTEERNGPFEVEFEYPITGVHYDELNEGMIISVTHDDNGDRQPFRIYRKSAPIDGIVTFNARHLCYDLRNVIVAPFTSQTCAGALSGLKTNAMTDCEFTFWTDKTTAGDWNLTVPRSAWELLGGSEGSILDVFGTGEYKLDNTTVRLYLHRGADNGVTIRYAKNLTDLTQEIDSGEVYNAIVPYWHSDDTGVTVYGDITVGSEVPMTLDYWTNENGLRITNENDVPFEFAYFKLACVVRDFSEKFEDQPTAAQLNAAALSFLNDNKPWIPKQNLDVDFVPLWQTEEYSAVAPLQKVKLCDTVRIIYNELGVNATAKVIRVVYNALTDRYDKIELGDARSNFADVITGEFDEKIYKLSEEFQGQMDNAIKHATDLITGGLGGYVIMKQDADGHPTEILITDNEDPDLAVHVLRININGIGFSSNGVEGPFTTAWTLDGNFVADFITSGTLNANLIKSGTLDGQYITVTNLSASNVSLDGEFVSTQHDPIAYETDNTVTINGGAVVLARENGTVIGKMRTFYVLDGDSNLVPEGGEIQLNNRLGNPCVYIQGWETGGSINVTDGNNNSVFSVDDDYTFISPGGNTLVQAGNGYVYIDGNLGVTGTKNRIIKTSHGNRALSAYETPEPYFGDIGESVIRENGTAEIPIDPLFAETIQTEGYQVFLQKYGRGDCWVSERRTDGFTVDGDPGLSFAWEIKGKQIDADGRLKEVVR